MGRIRLTSCLSFLGGFLPVFRPVDVLSGTCDDFSSFPVVLLTLTINLTGGDAILDRFRPLNGQILACVNVLTSFLCFPSR